MDMMVTGSVIAVVVLVLCIWLYMRFMRPQDDGRDDRYSPERILSTDQVAMLDYLHDTFPGQVVLPNVSLSNMLSVRRAANKDMAKQRLQGHRVDFIVCAPDGRPTFAFDIEQYHLSNAEAKAEKTKVKNRILKTAGVRFVFLKNGIHRMPSPADFRQQLNLAALPQPKAKEAQTDSVRQQLESKLSEFDPLYPATGFRDSDVMGRSRLMSLEEGLALYAANFGPNSALPGAVQPMTDDSSYDPSSSGYDNAEGISLEDADVETSLTDADLSFLEEAESDLAAERLADLQRVTAEYANYRKRVDRDRELIRDMSTSVALEQLIPILDDISRAREHGDLTGTFSTVADALSTVTKRLGLVEFGKVDEDFDPSIHEALSTMEDESVQSQKVGTVAQVGYKVGERILRPARVIVKQPPAK